jgi:signal transduction histidine kinase
VRSGRSSWWLVYGLCTAAVLGALGWVTAVTVRLERAWLDARAEASHQEALRLALWRMDSWLAPVLAREAARPYFAWQPFYAPPLAAAGEPASPQGQVLTPSELLTFRSDYVRLHFQVDAEEGLTSPQVPRGTFRALAETGHLEPQRIEANAAALDDIGRQLTLQKVESCVGEARSSEEAAAGSAAAAPLAAAAKAPEELNEAQKAWSRNELLARKGAYQQSQSLQIDPLAAQVSAAAAAPIAVGSFVGFWSGEGDEPGELVFGRPVRIGSREFYQGFVCDWPNLRAALLAQIGDLFAAARLVPLRGPVGEAATSLLATIPARLDVGPPAVVAAAALSPVRAALLLAWAAALAGAVAVAVTLQASIAFGRKRSRFASAVTHELRTPLTTFRMYSEMLADGMVQEPRKRQQYLSTLRDESGRLARLVESVLAYARLEEGRPAGRRVETALGELLARVVPTLEKRAAEAGMMLRVQDDAPRGAILRVDPEAVGQVLYNLVDNACKYAAAATDRTIHLETEVRDGRVLISVRDHGAGVPPRLARSIFAPFDRGSRDVSEGVPGVGLGLALARGLAADQGGTLELSCAGAGGACFTLTIPLRRTREPV